MTTNIRKIMWYPGYIRSHFGFKARRELKDTIWKITEYELNHYTDIFSTLDALDPNYDNSKLDRKLLSKFLFKITGLVLPEEKIPQLLKALSDSSMEIRWIALDLLANSIKDLRTFYSSPEQINTIISTINDKVRYCLTDEELNVRLKADAVMKIFEGHKVHIKTRK